MFTKKNENGKTTLTNLTKMLGSILTIISFVAAGVIYFETTYMHKAEAKEMISEIESQTVSTFKQQQKILELKSKDQERTMDMRFLEQLQTQTILIQKELERDPADTWLKEKCRRVQDLIKKLEDKLFQ